MRYISTMNILKAKSQTTSSDSDHSQINQAQRGQQEWPSRHFNGQYHIIRKIRLFQNTFQELYDTNNSCPYILCYIEHVIGNVVITIT